MEKPQSKPVGRVIVSNLDFRKTSLPRKTEYELGGKGSYLDGKLALGEMRLALLGLL
jgi:hypothetical protein